MSSPGARPTVASARSRRTSATLRPGRASLLARIDRGNTPCPGVPTRSRLASASSLVALLSGPTSSTMPMFSWPKTKPGSAGVRPSYMCRSEPRMLEAVMRMMSSVGASMPPSSGPAFARRWPCAVPGVQPLSCVLLPSRDPLASASAVIPAFASVDARQRADVRIPGVSFLYPSGLRGNGLSPRTERKWPERCSCV